MKKLIGTFLGLGLAGSLYSQNLSEQKFVPDYMGNWAFEFPKEVLWHDVHPDRSFHAIGITGVHSGSFELMFRKIDCLYDVVRHYVGGNGVSFVSGELNNAYYYQLLGHDDGKPVNYTNFVTIMFEPKEAVNDCGLLTMYFSSDKPFKENFFQKGSEFSLVMQKIIDSIRYDPRLVPIEFDVVESKINVGIVDEPVYLDPSEDKLTPEEALERVIWAYTCGYLSKEQFEKAALKNEYEFKESPSYPIFFDKNNFEEIWKAPTRRDDPCEQDTVKKHSSIFITGQRNFGYGL